MFNTLLFLITLAGSGWFFYWCVRVDKEPRKYSGMFPFAHEDAEEDGSVPEKRKPKGFEVGRADRGPRLR